MSIISETTKEILVFAAVTTTLRGDSGWTVKDCTLLGLTVQMLEGRRVSDEELRTLLKTRGWTSAAVKRINQLKNEWYRSLDYKAANPQVPKLTVGPAGYLKNIYFDLDTCHAVADVTDNRLVAIFCNEQQAKEYAAK